jgi:hypothetical protein
VVSAAPARYVVAADEAHPDAKRAAVAVAERLTTYAASETPADVVASLAADPAQRAALQTAAGPLWHAGSWSRGTVVYPQMGGFTPDRASVMVVTRQQVGRGSTVTGTETRTLDVWVKRMPSGTWVLDHLDSPGGTPVARPATLSPEALAVLDDSRISLPDTARWDIYRGLVSPRLLMAMHELATRTSYSVTVLDTGHPHNVFGSDHQSMHTKGLAFDVNAVDGRHVVDERAAGSTAWQLTRWLLAQRSVGQVGSPWDLDGPASRRSFTDSVHWDHLHVSV